MISTIRTVVASGGVRNVSEKIISAMSTSETLRELLALLAEILQPADHKDLYTDMANRLSRIAKKNPAWGWRYVQSVASGTEDPGKKFAKAVNTLAITFDGMPVAFAKSSPVTVYAETGTVKEGALVMAASIPCATPSCSVMFVPNVPWRKHCPVCSPPRSRDEKA